jgi:two-component system CheB/CheR fusion protein
MVGYDRTIEDIRAVLETLAPKEAEVQVKSGAWYLMRIRPYRTMENLIEGAVITLVDISERKKAEQLLRSSEARLNLFINEVYAGVSEADLAGRLTFVNSRFCDMLGYSREELQRMRLVDITDTEDHARVQARLDALINGGSHAQFDKRYVRRDGSRIRVLERVSVIRDERGQPASLLLLSFEAAEGKDGMQPG